MSGKRREAAAGSRGNMCCVCAIVYVSYQSMMCRQAVLALIKAVAAASGGGALRLVQESLYMLPHLCSAHTTLTPPQLFTLTFIPTPLHHSYNPSGIIKEVAITRLLSGHPCAVQLQGVYEDATTYYLVRWTDSVGVVGGLSS